MLVFISYPKEFEVAAEALKAQLASNNIKIFLDKDAIEPGDNWMNRLLIGIAKADIFVVLYMPEADIGGRIFHIEASRIVNACEGNEHKRLIPVIFPPATVEQVTPNFSVRHFVLADVAGDAKRGHEGWVDEVIQEIILERRRNTLKWWRQIATVVSFVAIIGVVLLSINVKKFSETIIGRDEHINHLLAELASQRTLIREKDEQVSKLKEQQQGNIVCNKLRGKYALDHKYTFIEGTNARSVATSATWVAKSCEFSREDNEWILEGDETTDFDVEMNVKGKWVRIARATYNYSSRVRISADGIPLGRTFTAVLLPTGEPKWFDKDNNGNSLNLTREEMKAAFDAITALRNERHEKMITAPCDTATRKKNGALTVLFTCGDYTRVMVKIL
jgi:hypothetical protein